MDSVWVSGTCTTTSPGLLSPPVSSRSTSHADQPVPFQASQASGGLRGSTPTPDTRQSSLITTAPAGTAFDRPIIKASPTTGDGWKQAKPAPPRLSVNSSRTPSAGAAAAWDRLHGTMFRLSMVEKTIGSAMSVRAVATSVSARTSTACGCGAESQKVTRPRAAEGGRICTPISSRNLT